MACRSAPREAVTGLASIFGLGARPSVRASSLFHHITRSVSSTPSRPATTSTDLAELEPSSSLLSTSSSTELVTDFDPVAQAQARKTRLPPSRYQYRPPRYYRGPLHPHQPPPRSDPSSREFVPGPFSLPRLEQTYASTIAPDLMVLSYQHQPPGYVAPTKAARLRAWDESSPYHAGRPLRGPRGGDVLRLLRKPVTFRNVPRLEGVSVSSFVRGALEDSAALHVASMAIQAITGQRCSARPARHNVQPWGLRAGKFCAVSVDLKGEDMYHFLSKCVDVVMPRIKDWKGVKGSSGDSSGNISFGFSPEVVAYFPEIEVNYDSYPPKLIPGCNITIRTSASTDRDARLLLTTLGIPFYGKLIN